MKRINNCVDVLIGASFGDEGKGKVVDIISKEYDIVARYNGGNNAGHTVYYNGVKHVLHLMPSGIFNKNCINVIGNGCVIDPVSLVKEIKDLENIGIDVKSKLMLSDKAHLVLPHHLMKDIEDENSKGNSKIGSTLKGISPTYTSKIKREGYRICDYTEENIQQKLNIGVHEIYRCYDDTHGGTHNEIVARINSKQQEYKDALQYLSTFNIIKTELFLNESIALNKRILAEGAQVALLDIDFGTYPYVTSSNTGVGGVLSGLGIPAQSINRVYGITKAYTTRVGNGPFDTELSDDNGKLLRKIGKEYGSTTGRPRRCGWLNLKELDYVCKINGITNLALMKLDVLSDFKEITVKLNAETDSYKTFTGWCVNISNVTKYEDLPEQCKIFINFISDSIGVEINIISVGPLPTQTISNYNYF